MTLHEFGLKHRTDKATWHTYCDFYQANLPTPESGQVKRLLEIGVKDGASLRMWRDYYPDATIVGLDIAKPIRVEGCTVLQMDATDVWAVEGLGRFDVIVDDGSHFTKDQQVAFTALWPKLNDGGWYVMEDVHTSFLEKYRNSAYSTYHELITRFGERALVWSRMSGDTRDSMTMMIKKT